ncbi:MAG: hypothetical protein V5A55_11485 [Halovenus sp.]
MEIDTDSLTTGGKVAVGAGVVTIASAFFPWVDLGIVSVSGIDGDGIFTAGFGVIVVALVVLREWNTAEIVGTGVLGVLIVLIAGNVYTNLGVQAGNTVLPASAGIGLHLTVLGGIGIIGAAVHGFLNERG